ncbi:MAG: hypothetical protein R3E66_22555 [bacterium]
MTPAWGDIAPSPAFAKLIAGRIRPELGLPSGTLRHVVRAIGRGWDPAHADAGLGLEHGIGSRAAQVRAFEMRDEVLPRCPTGSN